MSSIELSQMPKTLEESKTICCLCCESGPITAKMSLDKSGFVPGEAIRINGEIFNNSNRRIKDCHISLEQTSTFTARRHGHGWEKTRQTTSTVAKTEPVEIEAGDTLSLNGMNFQIPSIPPSYIPLCRIINLYYQLTLKAKPSGPSMNLSLPFGVIVGTIPMQDQFYNWTTPLYPQPQAPPMGLPPTGPPAMGPPAIGYDPNFKYPDGSAPPMPVVQQPLMPSAPNTGIPPPSYDACVYGSENKFQRGEDMEGEDPDSEDEDNWRPAYPFYDWSKHPAP